MFSLRVKITAITIAAIITTVLVLGGLGLYTTIHEGNVSSVEKMNLISQTEEQALDSYLDSLYQSMEMAINTADNSLEQIPELSHYGLEGQPPEKNGQSEEQAAALADEIKDHCDQVQRAFSNIADSTNGVATYYYCINPDVCPTEHGFFYSKVGEKEFKEREPLDARELDPDDIKHTTWYYSPIEAGHPVWIGPYTAHFLDEAWTVSYVTPIYKDKTLIGVLGMDILFETLIDQVDDIVIYDTGFVSLLDKNGRMLYHPQYEIGSRVEEINQLFRTAAFQKDNSGDEMIRYYVNGEERQLAFSTLSNGMKVVVVAPVREINISWLSLTTILLIASMIILVLFSVLTLAIMRAVTRPLYHLTAASQRLADGDYDVELDYEGNDEVGLLTRSFRQMRDRLKMYISDLNSRAYSDALTGIKNKGAFDIYAGRLNDTINRNEDENPPAFAIVMFDCNRLKRINDEYGHERGDLYLRKASRLICQVFAHSPVFRLGGDEFAVLLQEGEYRERDSLLQKFDQKANEINAAVSDPWEKVNVSKGMAVFQPDLDSDVEHVLRRADENMYEDKEKRSSILDILEDADKDMEEREQGQKESVLPHEDETDDEQAYEYIPVIHARKQILIADDIEMTREMMGELLAEDYDILYAADGVETMEVLRSHKDEIDLVLLDLLMPQMSGWEVIAQMHVDEDLMSIPVIILTVNQKAELDCLKSGAMDFIPKSFLDIEIVKARIEKCIELSEDRELIRYTERDKLTGLLNKDYFFRYVSRLDHLYKDTVLDAVVCDVNHFHAVKEQYGKKFSDHVLRSVGLNIRKLARETGGIGCRKGGDTFLLYCTHQDDYEKLFEEFLTEVFAEKEIADRVSMRFGVFTDAKQEPDVDERFVRAEIAADRIKDDPQNICGFYDLG